MAPPLNSLPTAPKAAAGMAIENVELGISSFPDHILCHILSLLPTKFAVATSVLARRWRFLWTRVVNLEFENEKSASDSENVSFSDFVDRVLLLHSVPSINTFNFSSGAENKRCKLDSWISAAIVRNVQVLDLHLDYLVMLPHCLFKCNTLVDLRLHNCHLSHEYLTVCLPRVKKLLLDSVLCDGYESLPRLISGCIMLEDLNIHRIIYGSKYMVYLYVSSPTLRRLTLNFAYCGYSKHIVELDTPALFYLKAGDPMSLHIYAPTLKSLVEAELCLCNGNCEGEFIDKRISSEFFESFVGVKCLTVSSGPSKTLIYAGFLAASMMFSYLTKLDWIADRRFLAKFLHTANMLEILIIREVDNNLKGWVEPRYVPLCLSSHIRTVSIYAFEGQECEHDMVRYILRHAEALKRINIYSECVGNDSESKFRALQMIFRWPRASKTCKILFC